MLLERAEQLACLNRLLQDARKSRRGQVALVTGPVASGKTELLHTFAEQATASGACFLSAAAARAERAVPLGLLGQLVRGAELPPGSANHVTRLLKEAAARAAFGPEREVGDHVAAYALHNLSQALLDVVEQVHGPLLIGIDDAQDADVASLECLSAFLRKLRRGRVLIVLTESVHASATVPRLEAGLRRESRRHVLQLAHLSPRGVRALLSQHLDHRTAERLTPDYYELSGGNPLLVQGLVADFLGSNGTGTHHPAAGSSFGEALLSCLYRCDPALLEAARCLAVLGEAATPALLGELAGLEEGTAQRAIDALNVSGVLSGGAFRHPAAEFTVLAGLPAPERIALRARATRLLYEAAAPATAIARQLVATEQADVPGAVPLLHEAAENALAADEVERALSFLRVAGQRGTGHQQRAATTALLMRAEGRTDPALVLRHVPELTAAARAGRLARGDLMTLAVWLLWFGDVEAARDALRRLDRQAAGDAPRRLDRPGAEPWAATWTRLAEQFGALPAEEPSVRTVAWAEQSLRQLRLDERTVAPIAAALVTLIWAGRPTVAESYCDSLLAVVRTRQAPTWHALFEALRAEIALRRGDLPSAEAHARTALAVLPPRSWGVAVGLPLSALLNATRAMNRSTDAAELLLTPVPDALFRTPPGLLYLQARGRHHHATGRFHAALADFRTVGTLMERWGMDVPALLPWRTDAAQSLLRLGEGRWAHRLAAEQLGRLRPEHVRERAITMRVLAAAGDPGRRPERLRQAVEALSGSYDRLELAHTLTDLGLAHRSLGEYGQARTLLRSARQLARQCGAAEAGRTLPPEADGEPAGSGPGEADDRWLAQLSDAEHRVAVLAASGYSNREIGTKLFVTVSTVEQHLTRVYRKLKMGRRSDLTRVLHPDLAPESMASNLLLDGRT